VELTFSVIVQDSLYHTELLVHIPPYEAFFHASLQSPCDIQKTDL